MTAIDFIQYSERMVGEASPDYSDTLNRALKTVVTTSGADATAFVGFALRPVVAPTVGQFYRATDTVVGASWQTLTTAMISDLTSAATGITKVGTVNTGVWQATSIATTYTDAKLKTATGTLNRVTVGGTATDPTFDIAATYVGQTSIVTLGTVTTGVWTGTSIGTAYTDAKVVSITGTASRVSVGGTATVPVIDIDAAYTGQTSIVTLGTVTTGTWQGTSIATGFTDAKIKTVTGTLGTITISGTATDPVFTISAAYIGQSTITTLGTITTGVWNGTAIATANTVAQVIDLTGVLNRTTIGGTATHPTVDISAAYIGQATITTLGTVTAGSWTATSIATTYTDAKIKTVTGTASRVTIGGTATDPTFDISAAYVGQATITTLGTITTGTWAATAITVDKGGTNLTSFTIGDIVYASGATTLSKLGIGTAAQILVTNGAATAPAWHTLATADITDLTSAATGITKVGTVTTGVWNAGVVSGVYGGTGVNNGSSVITLGGSLTTSGAFALTLTVTAGTNVTLPTTGTLVNSAVTSLASLTSVGGAFAISGAFTGATTGAFSSTLSTSQLTITDTASRIIPGATSLSLRNNANNADNILISDAGAITVRSTIGGVTTISGTTASFTTLTGTLSTAAQPNVTSTGVLASLHMTSAVIDSGGLTITGAASITGGAGNMTILSGTGASRTMIFQTTTAGGSATTALTLNADQTATFAAAISVTGNSTITGTLGGITILTATTLAGTLSTASQPNVTTLASALTTGTINGQTISATASFTGTVTAAGEIAGTNIKAAAINTFYWTGRSTIWSPADGVVLLQNAASTDFGRLQFGGSTASFPSIKRSTTALLFRLADDSGYCAVQGSTGTFTTVSTDQLSITAYAPSLDFSGASTGSVANNGTATIGGGIGYGWIYVVDVTSGATAIVAFSGSGGAVVWQSGAEYTITSGNATTSNLFISAGQVTIENKTGGARTYRVFSLRGA